MKHKPAIECEPYVWAQDSNDQIRSIILAVGEIALWRSAGRLLRPSAYLTYAEFSDLTSDVLSTMQPDIVVSSLVSKSFDCLDLAQFLHGCDFTGRYRIIDQHVPDPRMILKEINMLCPGLDVMVVPLAQATQMAH